LIFQKEVEALQRAADAFQRAAVALQREADVFQRAADVFQRAADALQRAVDVFQRATDVFQRAADVFQRATDVFQRAADALQRGADAFHKEVEIEWQLIVFMSVAKIDDNKARGNSKNEKRNWASFVKINLKKGITLLKCFKMTFSSFYCSIKIAPGIIRILSLHI
jgi:predicted O-linked N-acetylglucosamine transferase (SPINDLY family)